MYRAHRSSCAFLDAVVAVGSEQRGVGAFLPLRFDDVAQSLTSPCTDFEPLRPTMQQLPNCGGD
jgi:hypothetical protein